MKITMNVDCTPEEARAFLGLPDLGPLHEQLLQEIQERMKAGMGTMDAADIMQAWMPSMKNFEQFQSMFGQKPKSGKE